MSSFKEFLREAMNDSEEEKSSPTVSNTPENLRKGYDSLNKKYTFQPGDLVMWKEGMANKKVPKVGEPAIVTEILAETVLDPEANSGPYFRERLSIKVGTYEKNTFVEFHYDSRRFEPYVPKQ